MTAPSVVHMLVGVAALAAAVDTALLAVRGELFTEYGWIGHGWPLITLTGLLSALMGAVILTRDARQPIGWLLLLPGVTTCLSLALDAYSGWVMQDGGPGGEPAAMIAGWLAALISAQIPLAANAVILLLAPVGRPAGRWSRALIGVAAVGAAAWSTPPVIEAAEYARTDPRGGTASVLLSVTGVALVSVALFGGAAGLFLRLRRATGVPRLQLRWFVIAGLPLAVALAWLLVYRFVLEPRSDAVTQLPVFLAELVFPLSIAVAVLRYRLYDIDLVLNRAWLVLAAAGFVGSIYVLLVVVIGRVPGGWASVLVSALVACAFQPLRSRLVAVADRWAYGRRVEPYVALAELNRRLGAGPAPQDALLALARACLRSTAIAAVDIDLLGADGRVVAHAEATSDPAPRAGAPAEAMPVLDRGEQVGAIRVTAAPGRPLRPHDRGVLTELCDQAGVAFRTLRLDAELAARVADLAAITEALQRSDGRVREALAAEQRRLEETLRSAVTPALQVIADKIDALDGRSGSRPDEQDWLQVTEEIGRTLTTLRAVSHGLHSGLLDSFGLAAALRHHAADTVGPALRVAQDLQDRRFDADLEAAVYGSVVLARREMPHLREIAVATAPDGLVVVATADLPVLVPAELHDQVEGNGGTIAADLAGEAPRWVLHFPAPAEERVIADRAG